MPTTWNFYTAGQLVFGWGAVKQLGRLLAERSARRVLVITDPHLEAAGVADAARRPLHEAEIEVGVFDGGEAEPSIEAAERAIEQARRFQPHALVGLGGGSNIDLAKVTAAVITHGGSLSDYFGFDKIPGPVLPLVCIPTTAGTGSEVSHAAVLTDTAGQMKVSTLSNYLRPALALVDPQLTVSCPRQVTADSGIDALTHAIEAYTAVDYDQMQLPPGQQCAYDGRYPLGQLLAEEAIRLVGQHLVTAVEQPDSRQARQGMSLAATLAGIAFSNCGVALVHALEYPLGGALHCSHGAGNGLLLPHVMRFNLPERRASLARIAELLGRDVQGLGEDAAAEAAIDAVQQLARRVGIPQRLRDIGGTEDQIPLFARRAFTLERLRWVNPRPSSLDDFEQILRAAF